MDLEFTASAIADFALADAERRDQLRSSAPPPRTVDILDRSWDVWLTAGGRPGSTSYVGPLDRGRVAAAADARRVLDTRSSGHRGADREIGRSHLVSLSTRAATSNERRCIALWVASMMWGSGTANGRGPWRTAEGLADDDLGSILVRSHRALRAGSFDDAYEMSSTIRGSGESCFTKWLWACSIGLPDAEVGALILDNRVRGALAGAGVRPQHSATGYSAYVRAMVLAASTLRREHKLKGATPERLELMLSGSSSGTA